VPPLMGLRALSTLQFDAGRASWVPHSPIAVGFADHR
jgi:hypothetical protein